MLQQRWDGLMCCSDDWEIRQPQDFVRGVPDTQIAPWLRPEPADSFIPVTIAQWLLSYITASVTLQWGYIKFRTLTSDLLVTISTILKTRISGNKSIDGTILNRKTLG